MGDSRRNIGTFGTQVKPTAIGFGTRQSPRRRETRSGVPNTPSSPSQTPARTQGVRRATRNSAVVTLHPRIKVPGSGSNRLRIVGESFCSNALRLTSKAKSNPGGHRSKWCWSLLHHALHPHYPDPLPSGRRGRGGRQCFSQPVRIFGQVSQPICSFWKPCSKYLKGSLVIRSNAAQYDFAQVLWPGRRGDL